MRLVTLYTASKKQVRAYGGYLPIHVYEPPIEAFNTSDVFIKAEVDVHHAKIHRFHKSDKYHTDETFVAFDPALQSIVDILNSKNYDKGVQAGKKACYAQIEALNDFNNHLQSRTIWSMIAGKFKRSK